MPTDGIRPRFVICFTSQKSSQFSSGTLSTRLQWKHQRPAAAVLPERHWSVH